MKCPIHCGQCCDYWRNVSELVSDAVMHPNTVSCPHLSEHGCSLQRNDRPVVCVEYLCGVAQAVIAKQISFSTGVRFKADHLNEVPAEAVR